MEKTTKAKFSNLCKNCMGTASFDLQIEGMRKPQEFVVYPIQETNDADKIHIQSDHRYGILDTNTGKGRMSANKNQYANSFFLAICEAKGTAVDFELTQLDLQTLRMFIFTTAKKLAGDNCISMYCDNSNAINILNGSM